MAIVYNWMYVSTIVDVKCLTRLRELKIECRKLLEAARIGLSVYGKNLIWAERNRKWRKFQTVLFQERGT